MQHTDEPAPAAAHADADAARPAVTIRDVAAAAGVHPSTVSRAFSRPGRVNALTAQRIFAAADALGYRVAAPPHAPGDDAVSGLVAIMAADLGNLVYGEIVSGFQHQCAAANFGTIIVDTEETGVFERKALLRIVGHVDGVVLTSSRLSDQTIRKIAELKPIVAINRSIRGIQSVIADTSATLDETVGLLATLGHTALTYLAGPQASWQNGVRWQTLMRACAARGMVLRQLTGHTPTLAGGMAAVDQFMARPSTAVIAYNDVMAIGFIEGLRQRGVPVPGRVSVTGIDDIPGMAALLTPSLTTIRLPRRDIGRRAATELLGHMGHSPARRSLKPVMMPTRLIVRSSTGPAVG